MKKLIVFLAVVMTATSVCAQSGVSVSLTKLGSWATDGDLLMVVIAGPNASSTDDCYIRSSGREVTDNITVQLITEHGTPVIHINDSAWTLKFEFESGDGVSQCLASNFIQHFAEAEISQPFTTTIHFDGIFEIGRRLPFVGNGVCRVSLVYQGPDPEPQVFELGRITFISPDINGDNIVNNSDMAYFTQRFQTGTYDHTVDFSYDGVHNLADIAYFTQAIGTGCN